jgi:hypothetical protein
MASEMCTIIFPWGKYSYLRLPMGFAGSADIFQAEMGNLMTSLKYVWAYIDDLLVITKGSLNDHLVLSGRLRVTYWLLTEEERRMAPVQARSPNHHVGDFSFFGLYIVLYFLTLHSSLLGFNLWFTWRNLGHPAQPGLICQSVRACAVCVCVCMVLFAFVELST